MPDKTILNWSQTELTKRDVIYLKVMNEEDSAKKCVASWLLTLSKLHHTVIAAILVGHLNYVGLWCQLIKMMIELEPYVRHINCCAI